MVTAGGVAVTLALAGCSGDDAPDPRGATYTTAMMQAGVLEPADIGTAWKRPAQTPPTTSVTPLCPGVAKRPPVPGSPTGAVAASMADEGEKGAQAFDQLGLVYKDAAAMEAAFTSLQDAMEACPPSASRSAAPRDDTSEAGYTETATVDPLESGGWKGFVTVRHKVYEPTYPGSADVAVAVVGQGNAIVVASYAVYWVGSHSAGPEFDADWRRVVGTVLSRVDAKRPSRR
ncbi:hypothetical protein ACPPVO_45900 [Dactylosporangium sp. McL0621]|uniref:hypothetical protein n=1 Tax=Dactylosporangium sp. McL0621 TaxID=3415678 RepID=UPI003CEA2FD3